MKALIACLVVISIVAGLAIWRMNQSTDERRIQRQLQRLSEYSSKDGEESMTQMAGKMNQLSTLFYDTFTVDLTEFPANGVYSAGEIASQAARVRPAFDLIQLTFLDSDISVISPERATAVVTARLTVRPKGGEANADTRELTVTLCRQEGSVWKFCEFTESQVIKK